MADRLYLPPVGTEILQGDIFDQMPSVRVESRPLRVARHWKQSGPRDIWEVHPEDGSGPRGGFKWLPDQGGEQGLLVHAYLGRAMVLSHDCEIENDPRTRTLAMIRPINHLDEASQRELFSGGRQDRWFAVFPLVGQIDEPRIERSFVDFRRLTTVHPDVLAASIRVASLSEELRSAVAERFRLYLFRRVDSQVTDVR
ncbi:MAG: hypothetical protein ABSA21_13535 [Candidatus Limnocylindrales bacterium]